MSIVDLCSGCDLPATYCQCAAVRCALPKLRPLVKRFKASYEDTVHHGRHFPHNFDSFRLDYLHVNAELTKASEVRELIEFLQIHERCFTVGGKDLPENPEAGAMFRRINVEPR